MILESHDWMFAVHLAGCLWDDDFICIKLLDRLDEIITELTSDGTLEGLTVHCDSCGSMRWINRNNSRPPSHPWLCPHCEPQPSSGEYNFTFRACAISDECIDLTMALLEGSTDTSTRSSEDWGTDSDEDVSDTDHSADMALIERALAEHERERLSDCDLVKEIEAMDRALEETRGGWHGPMANTAAAASTTAKPTVLKANPSLPVQLVTQTLAGAKFPSPDTPSAEGFLVGHPTIRVMADIEPEARTHNLFYVSIANIKPTKLTMLVENEVNWWLQRARCVLKRRKDTRKRKKARRMANLRQAIVLKNNVGRCRQPRHRNKRKEYKVAAPASGQRRRRLLKEDLQGKVKTRKEGGAPGECVPLPGVFNYFFTHLINCMLGCFLVVWSTNAALSGCLVRGQLV
jgi:hypothetical protein